MIGQLHKIDHLYEDLHIARRPMVVMAICRRVTRSETSPDGHPWSQSREEVNRLTEALKAMLARGWRPRDVELEEVGEGGDGRRPTKMISKLFRIDGVEFYAFPSQDKAFAQIVGVCIAVLDPMRAVINVDIVDPSHYGEIGLSRFKVVDVGFCQEERLRQIRYVFLSRNSDLVRSIGSEHSHKLSHSWTSYDIRRSVGWNFLNSISLTNLHGRSLSSVSDPKDGFQGLAHTDRLCSCFNLDPGTLIYARRKELTIQHPHHQAGQHQINDSEPPRPFSGIPGRFNRVFVILTGARFRSLLAGIYLLSKGNQFIMNSMEWSTELLTNGGHAVGLFAHRAILVSMLSTIVICHDLTFRYLDTYGQ